ncbi:hypothetical protein D9B87_10830 [Corynebacterium diphtheriae]|nr:hypothetical protein D9B42_10905 [Corynebacterium diphtheriae]RKW76639.1 hypothetical protein D9B34_10995 [Corynebacterium diphtheriae]RKW83219.1 hypothetical protein D9D07_10970 [Corynebacterium diphtheriae]RKW87419.1 hypothetical protein D9B87_10830 [Corynebacterium diphtheriae]RKW94915.1 hypothetical protein D9B52_10715 [Corynebacterium diphtheriae]
MSDVGDVDQAPQDVVVEVDEGCLCSTCSWFCLAARSHRRSQTVFQAAHGDCHRLGVQRGTGL